MTLMSTDLRFTALNGRISWRESGRMFPEIGISTAGIPSWMSKVFEYASFSLSEL